MSNLIEIILSFFNKFFDTIYQVIVDLFVLIVNAVLSIIASLIKLMASIMPSLSLGVDLVTPVNAHTAICWLNWLFPVDVLFQCTQFFISLYLLKFMSNPILRFLKIVE